MRIALITSIINIKSGARAPYEIARALKKRGHQITVLGYDYNLEKDALFELKKENIDVKLFKKSNRFALPMRIANFLKKGLFDLISFHSTLPFFLGAKLSGIPIVRTYYGSQFDPIYDKFFGKKPTLLTKLLNFLANIYIKSVEKLVLKSSAKVVAISKYTKNELKKLYSTKANYVYLGGGFNSKSRNTRPSHTPKDSVNIISVSRIVPYKGFHHLIFLFNKLNKKFPQARLTIIGSAPQRQYLDYLNKIKNSNTNIITNASDRRLKKAYRQADIYASFDRYMFFGMPIIEAAYFSLPSVSITKCAAVETIVQGKTGYLAQNSQEFEKYLTKLIEDPKARAKMGRAAEIWAGKFSWAKTAKEYEKIFNQVTSRN